jgi:hypothetical protein
MNSPHAIGAGLLTALLAAGPAGAAEAQPPSDPSRPVTTVRIGGSAADRDFRAARQAIAARYREARAACRNRPAAERSGCVSAARAELKRAQGQAQATHAAATKKAR